MTHPGKPPSAAFLLIASATAAYVLVHLLPYYSVRGSFIYTFLAACSVSFGCLAVYVSQIWPKFLSPLRGLPHPSGPSFWHGHLWSFLTDDPILLFRRWASTIPNNGIIRWTGPFNWENLLLTSAEALREVLVTKSYDFEKPDDARAMLIRFIGHGVLVAEGEEHKSQRKSLMPAFQYRHIKDLVPTFWATSAKMVRRFEETHGDALAQSGGATVEFETWLTRCTLDIIGITGMGFDFNSIEEPNSELNVTYRRIFNPTYTDIFLEIAGWFVPLSILKRIPLPRNFEIDSSVATVRRISRELVQQKKKKIADGKGERVDKDILSIAVESGNFSETTLVDQTMTFLAAGHETTSSAAAWAMVALAENSQMQTRLRKEIRRYLPSPMDEQATITAEMIDQCEYLHAVCSEVLRFYAPVPFTRRQAVNDTVVSGSIVKKGTNIILSPAVINRSEALWGRDAGKFDPERWMGKNVSSGGADNNFSFLTFLHGPRSCIGQAFSRQEFACLLASVVGSYRFELNPRDQEVAWQAFVTMRPAGGVNLRMWPTRGGWSVDS